MPRNLAEILTVQLPEGGLSIGQYRAIETALDEWATEVKTAARSFPARSYELGVAQTTAFLRLAGHLGQMDLPPAGLLGPTKELAVQWLDTYTLAEIDGALDKYIDAIKSALLYGLRGAANPTQVASWLYKATSDANVNWRTIARTEMARANAMGRLDSIKALGHDQCWIPPHVGACKKCKRLLENQVFDVDELRQASNFGRPAGEWVAALPLHPHCRHIALPYVKEIVDESLRERELLDELGLDDKTLNEMYDESGQLKPEFENDPRLAQVYELAGKTVDPLTFALGEAVAKVSSSGPWLSDDSVAAAHIGSADEQDGQGRLVAKGFFDNPQPGLDPLIWHDERLREDVRDRLTAWWRYTFGPDAPLWSHLYLTGGATSYQWASRTGEKDPDLDLQVVVDYPALRDAHPEYATLSDPEIHAALATQAKAALDDVEAAPGVRLDAFVRDETSEHEFTADVARAGQGTYDVIRGRWTAPPVPVPDAETVEDGHFLEGAGGHVAAEHPEWLAQAHELAGSLRTALDRAESGPGLNGELVQLREAYKLVHDLREQAFHGGGGNTGLGNFLWQYLVNYGPLMQVKHLLHPTGLEKVWHGYGWSIDAPTDDVAPSDWPLAVGTVVAKSDGMTDRIAARSGAGIYETDSGEQLRHVDVQKAAEATDAGAEHWITVHPHGPGTDGQAVLVRNSPDGKSMVVIGGAGGHLNYLRIDRSRQMKPADGSKGPDQGPANEPGDDSFENKTPEQIAAEEHEQQQQMEQAAAHLATIKERQGELKGQLQDYVKGLIDDYGKTAEGEKAGWDDLDQKQQQEMLAKLKFSALHIAAHGPLAKQDVNEAGMVLPIVAKEEPDAAEKATLEQALKDEQGDEFAGRPEYDDGASEKEKKPRLPAVALTVDQADQINTLLAEASILNKQAGKARKVAAGKSEGSDALALDYKAEDVDAAKKLRISSEQRTGVARSILDTAESSGAQKKIAKATRNGGYDTVDTFAQAVLGDSQIDPKVTRLLGVAGSAQLVAHKLYTEAKAGRLDIDKAYDALSSLVDEREVEVASRARGRALAAAEQVKEALEAEKLSGSDEDSPLALWTKTAAKSVQSRKINEAAASLGMAIGGLEAASALKVALERVVGPAGTRQGETGNKIRLSKGGIDHIRIAGFEGKYAIKQLAEKAGVEVSDKDIRRLGTGNHELTLDPRKLEHLFRARQDPKRELNDRLQGIRTAKEDNELVEEMQDTPGMVHTLSPAQAKGKMFLLAAEHGLLAFEPGVGKTHTAVAAAMHLMHSEPGKGHRAMVVVPKSVAREWRDTVKAQGGSHSVQVIGAAFDDGDPENPSADKQKGKSGDAKRAQVDAPCDFNIVTYESLRADPDLAAKLGCSIHIADEIQKAKNEKSGINRALTHASHQDSVAHRWALTGTPIEKNTGDIHSMLSWANPDGIGDQKTFRDKFDQTAQYQHVSAEDRIRQFRENISDRMFHLSAQDAGNDLPERNADNDGGIHHVSVELSAAHRELLRQKVKEVNDTNADLRERRKAGERDSQGRLIRPSLAFGGRDIVMSSLHKPEGIAVEDHAIAQKVSELCEGTPDFDYDGGQTGGQHAGKYAGKTVVFAEQVGHLAIVRKALEARGIKVFEAHGSKSTDGSGKQLSDADNSNNIAAWKAHGGKAVLLTSDKNNAGVNLQLGTAKGQFQHGATRMVHLTLPMNNAKIAQREARIHRRGSVAPVDTYHVTANTPFEKLDQDRLTEERRRLDLVGNREDDVATAEGGRTRTLRQRYTDAGGRLASEMQQGEEDPEDTHE